MGTTWALGKESQGWTSLEPGLACAGWGCLGEGMLPCRRSGSGSGQPDGPPACWPDSGPDPELDPAGLTVIVTVTVAVTETETVTVTLPA